MDAATATTHFNWLLDGGIVGLYLLATMIAGLMVRRYVGKVEDFLVAGREMNVYLGIASLAATEFGIVTAMYVAQAGYTRGFSGAIPGVCEAIVMLVVGMSGFCVRKLRDSGAMTLPELYQNRFGSQVRWLSGVVIVLGGLLNMGAFLRLGGEFLVVTCGFQLEHLVWMMTAMLLAVAIYTIMGGMLSVLVTDFLQFIVMSVGLLAVSFLVMKNIGWDSIVGAVKEHVGPSGLNPIADPVQGSITIAYQLVFQLAVVLTWQTVIARFLAAKNSQTGLKVYKGTSFFFVCRFIIPAFWGMAALWFLHQPENARHMSDLRASEVAAYEKSAGVSVPASQRAALVADSTGYEKALAAKPEAERTDDEKAGLAAAGTVNDRVSRHAMPKFLGLFVPVGLMGLLIAAMLAADMSTDSSYMLTWGSVIYNDIMAPFRRRNQWSEKKGLAINRMIVALIGIFLFFFGLYFELPGSVLGYLWKTGEIYMTSMLVLLISCCYWPKANNWGANAAIITGAAVPIGTMILQIFFGGTVVGKFATTQNDLMGLLAFAAAGAAMVIGSNLKPAGNPANT